MSKYEVSSETIHIYGLYCSFQEMDRQSHCHIYKNPYVKTSSNNMLTGSITSRNRLIEGLKIYSLLMGYRYIDYYIINYNYYQSFPAHIISYAII